MLKKKPLSCGDAVKKTTFFLKIPRIEQLKNIKKGKVVMIKKMQEFITEGKEIFVGLEDSKKSWKICIRTGGAIIHETSMPADYNCLHSYFKKYKNCKIKIIYEAGFKGFNLYDRLTEDSIECVVLPPHLMTQPKVLKVKTDKRDARRLALMLENNDYRCCNIPDKERREDRQICRTLNAVEKEIKSTRNRIRKLLQFHGKETGIPDKKWQKKDFRDLGQLPLSESLNASLKILLSLLETLWTYQIELRKELIKLCKKPRYVQAFKIIKGMPGIGWLTAIRLILELGEDLTKYHSNQALAAFVGLTGREYSTGEKIHRGRITGMGNNFVRSWLVECAWTSIRKDPALQEFYQRINKNTGSSKKAIVAVARKLLSRLRSCVINNEPYLVGVIE